MSAIDEVQEQMEQLKKEQKSKSKDSREETDRPDRCPPEEFTLINQFGDHFKRGITQMAHMGADVEAVNDVWMEFGDCLLNSRQKAIDELYKLMLLTAFRFYMHTRYQIERRMDDTTGKRYEENDLDLPADVAKELLPRLHRQERHLRELMDDYTTQLKRAQDLREPSDSVIHGDDSQDEEEEGS